jgi:hypothetical protein
MDERDHKDGGKRIRFPRSAYRTLDDHLLVSAMQQGDERAIDEFIIRYQRVLADRVRQWRVALLAVEDTMSDVLEDIAVLIVNRRIAPTRSLGAYVVKAFRARLALQSKTEKQREYEPTDGGSGLAASISQATLRASQGADWEPDACRHALRRLSTMLDEGISEEERRILAWLSNYVSQRDICSWLGVSYAAGTQRIWRLRERLRTAAKRHASAFSLRDQLELTRFFQRSGYQVQPPARSIGNAEPGGGSDDTP